MRTQLTNKIECGVDEAGRGCLAGPVTAAAVILPANYKNSRINDSKKLSEKERTILQREIIKDCISYSVSHVSPKIIDKINILNASIKAMHLSINKLKVKPNYILVDGNKFKAFKKIPHKCVVKGDSKFLNIAAASILAKTFRDKLMENYHMKYPEYGWKDNKGYPTLRHRKSLKKYGVVDIHRKTFKLYDGQTLLDF
ncbi:MAG: ribonuclease HII [Flavobacteriales bacterium]|nr:ribonuclease HII [Flavobacteriales bacterium]|tara:strand:- start:67 stop:660 length:594 start_codon:yes stop_codon:yes gene_type:complete